MKSSFHFAGAVALGAALVLTGCTKNSDSSSTTSASATGAPADATTAAPGEATLPTSAASTNSTTVGGTTVSGSNGGGKAGFISIPVYPGATPSKDQGMSMSSNGTSVSMEVWSSKDDSKAVADWYKTHLPGAWKNAILSTDGKTVGTFSNEMTDGDQSVIVASQDDKTTRIQLTTKHGK